MKTHLAILLGKCVHLAAKLLRLGAGGTWPGEIALRLSPHLLTNLSSQIRKGIVVVAGTNGKTTTSLMITQMLEAQGLKVVHNATGANLLNGVVSSLIQKSDWSGKMNEDWGVFETDENSLPIVLKDISRQSSDVRLIVVLLNLFRDQLDRYGEVDVIAEKWQKTLEVVSKQWAVGRQNNNFNLILNADDPLITHLGKSRVILEGATRPIGSSQKDAIASLQHDENIVYFGINDKKHYLKIREHAVDSIFCLNCGARLQYEGIYYSHIGIWKCASCGEKRPKPDIDRWPSPLSGLYNQYNTLAAVSTAKAIGIEDEKIKNVLSDFIPAFGRQEEFEIDGKKIKLFLSKNPAGFNQSLRTIFELGAKNILLVLNDRIPDGRDISWIWDVDMEMISDTTNIVVSGDRAYDLGLRMKYAKKSYKVHKVDKVRNENFQIEPKLEMAIAQGLMSLSENETLYILATYSAMLEVRKILKRRKIL